MNRRRARKLLAKLKKPGGNKNCRYKKIAAMLVAFDFEPPRKAGGSHRVFKHPSGVRVGLVDSGSGTILPVYVDEAIEAIEKVEGAA